MKQLKNRNEIFHNWIENVVSCLWRGVEAVSGKILFV